MLARSTRVYRAETRPKGMKPLVQKACHAHS